MAAGASVEEWGPHLLLLYRNASQQQDSVALWVQRGLNRGEKVLCAEGPGDPALVRRMTQRGVDVSGAQQRSQFRFLSLDELYPAGRQSALVRRALDDGYPGVRLAAHADVALTQIGEKGYQLFDEEMDDLCAHLRLSALCQYDTRAGPGLGTVIEAHPDAVQDAQMRAGRRDDRMHVAGEVDLASAGVLTRWLGRACGRARVSQVVLDLSELTFIDVAGCRALVSGTDSFRSQAGVVFVTGLRGNIRRIMTLLALDRLRGMELL